jgi:hypothetical protein
MSYQLRTIKTFDNELKQLSKRHHSLKADILQLGKELQENPLVGADLGHGVRKVRLAITSKGGGKSGGARVITHTDVVTETRDGVVYFLSIYDKSDQSTISDKRIKELLKEAGIK